MKFLLLIATALIANHAFAETHFTPSAAAPANMDEVAPGVYRGSRIENAEQMKYLVNTLHVKIIVNLQGGDDKSPWIGAIVDYFEPGETTPEIKAERQLAIMTGLNPSNYVRAPLNSLKQVTRSEAKRIYEVIRIMSDPAAQPVYVHCAHGADRTGLVVALYRLINQQMTVDQAYQEMVDHGHNLWHQAFTHYMDRSFLKQAEKILRHN
jgi:protein tyrosine/serine phosphatase